MNASDVMPPNHEHGIQVMELSQSNLAKYYIAVGIFFVFLYDIIITLEDERRFIWMRRWTLGKVFFLLIRWPWFVMATVSVYSALVAYPSRQFCSQSFMWENFLGACELAIVQFVLVLRTWVIFEKSRVIAISLFPLPLVYMVAMLVLDANYLPRLDIIESPAPEIMPGCYRDWSNYFTPHPARTFIPLIAFDGLIFILTLYKAWKTSHNNTSTPILTLLYQQGFVYFIAMFAYTFAAMFICSVVDTPFELMLASLRSLHGILTCRLILSIRGLISRSSEISDYMPTESNGGPIPPSLQLRVMQLSYPDPSQKPSYESDNG